MVMSFVFVVYFLYQWVLCYDLIDIDWLGCDWFIFLVGYLLLMQYVQFYFGGFGFEFDDFKVLCIWGFKMLGYLEYGYIKGVEIIIGFFGQGFVFVVGFVYVVWYECGFFDFEVVFGMSLFDYFVYVIVGDGDLQEGVISEVFFLVGYQQFGNFIVIYDLNQIFIEDDMNVVFIEDVVKCYEVYGWQVQVVDWKKIGEYVEDVVELYVVIEVVKGEIDKFLFIIFWMIIGWLLFGKQNFGKIYGFVLGVDEFVVMKKVLGFDLEQIFMVVDDVIVYICGFVDCVVEMCVEWQKLFDVWVVVNFEKKVLFDWFEVQEFFFDIMSVLFVFEVGKEVLICVVFGQVINVFVVEFFELWGGFVDFVELNFIMIKDVLLFILVEWFIYEWLGNFYGWVLYFGICEYVMGVIVNGIVLYGLMWVFGGMFFIFSDYMWFVV